MSNPSNDLNCDYRLINFTELPYDFSERILNPTLTIDRRDGKYVAMLGAVIIKSGRPTFVSCPSIKHNWILDGNFIKPLPFDSPQIIENNFKVGNTNNLSYPEIIATTRNGLPGIEIIISPSVTEKANARSENLYLPQKIEGLNADLYQYQKKGVAWLNEAIETIGGAVLADEMGLGKTLQIIALLLIKKPSIVNPALIVCPTTLIANWKREIHKFSPRFTLVVHRGNDRASYYKNLQRSNIVITTYDTLVNDISLFKSIDWSFVICDEAQAVKNPNAKRRIAIGSLTRQHTIPVTGTPVENSLLDLWSLADLAIPGILGSKECFIEQYPDTEEGARALGILSDIFILKRQVKDVASDLPPRTDVDIPIELDSTAITEYERIREETIKEYGLAGQLVAVGQLAMYCAHPWLRIGQIKSQDWEDNVEVHARTEIGLMTPKMELCIQLLKEAAHSNKKVLIFSAFNCCGDLIKRAAEQNNIPIYYWDFINGSTPQEKRQLIVDYFTNIKGSAVLILNPKAAGAGLNITAATVVIHFTQNWNPALEMQASARSHRRGQELPVTVYRLFYERTVEETMIERCSWKRELGNEAIPIAARDKQDLEKAIMASPIKEIR